MTKETKNIAINLLIAMAILAGLVWLLKDKMIQAESQNADSSIISTGQNSFDFGNISMAKGTVSHDFRIKNSGGSSQLIEKIYTSCMCTQASFLKNNERFGPFGMPGHGLVPNLNEELKPGEEAEIEVIFDPAAHGPAGIGKIERSVYIYNSENSVPLEFKFTAEVTP